jgi:hypothetical protein
MKPKLFWNLMFVCVAITVGIAASMKPWQVYSEQKKIADKSMKEMREAEKSRAELTKEKARFESSVGREELARNQNYRRPDEKPIYVGD